MEEWEIIGKLEKNDYYSRWMEMDTEEQKGNDETFLHIFEDADLEPIDYVRAWANTPIEIQEKYSQVYDVVLSAAEKIPSWYSTYIYRKIVENTSGKIVKSNPEIYEKAIKEAINTESKFDLAQLYLYVRNDFKEDNPELFEKIISQIREYPEGVVHLSCSPIMKESFTAEDYFSSLDKMQESGMSISQYTDYTYVISPEELKNIPDSIKKSPFFLEQRIGIEVKDISELTLDEIDLLKQEHEIEDIRINCEGIELQQKEPYSVEQFVKCREIIDELLEGVDFGKDGDPDREKKIFGQVIKRLAHHMKYDHAHVGSYRNIEEKIKEIKAKLENGNDRVESGNLSAQLASLQAKYNEVDFTTPRNMVGGLINGTCVCAGYAEIVRNVFACVGIEAKYIFGMLKEEGEAGHAWNQIKLDGEWYNMDLTWDRDRIVNGEFTQHLLKDNKDFNENGHEEFSLGRPSNEELCYNRLSDWGVQEYLNFKTKPRLRDKCAEFLRGISEKCRMGKVQEMGKAVLDAGNRVRGRSYDKDERDR